MCVYTILWCNIAPVTENQFLSYDLNFCRPITGSIRVACQPGPMKEHFSNQHPSDILVAFWEKKKIYIWVFMRSVAYRQYGPL